MKNITIAIGLLLLFLAGCIAADQILLAKARPPKSVVDFNSCLAWRSKPMGAFTISSGTNTYYILTGPAGRSVPSGPAGYAFDERGHFLGWSSDIGDYKNPPELFRDGTKRTRIAIEEIKSRIIETTR